MRKTGRKQSSRSAVFLPIYSPPLPQHQTIITIHHLVLLCGAHNDKPHHCHRQWSSTTMANIALPSQCSMHPAPPRPPSTPCIHTRPNAQASSSSRNPLRIHHHQTTTNHHVHARPPPAIAPGPSIFTRWESRRYRPQCCRNSAPGECGGDCATEQTGCTLAYWLSISK